MFFEYIICCDKGVDSVVGVVGCVKVGEYIVGLFDEVFVYVGEVYNSFNVERM